jgi:phosphatidylglycerophosphate synthase
MPASPDHHPWDARLARRLVAPLRGRRISPNHLTTLRLLVGVGSAAAFMRGTYGWSNAAALLLGVSNFLDHADGELARINGASSRGGHVYDLASDAAVTILVFIAIGAGLRRGSGYLLDLPPVALGAAAGTAIALIFYLRMRIETLAGKTATRQASFLGFETEDVLYLMPLITLCHGLVSLLIAAGLCAPLYAAWTIIEYLRLLRRVHPVADRPSSRAVR